MEKLAVSSVYQDFKTKKWLPNAEEDEEFFFFSNSTELETHFQLVGSKSCAAFSGSQCLHWSGKEGLFTRDQGGACCLQESCGFRNLSLLQATVFTLIIVL